MMNASIRVLFERSPRAEEFGRKPSVSITCRSRASVSALMCAVLPLTRFDTVWTDTPAALATSRMVGRAASRCRAARGPPAAAARGRPLSEVGIRPYPSSTVVSRRSRRPAGEILARSYIDQPRRRHPAEV